MDQENFFIRVKLAREKLGLSQKDIADRIGVSTNTIQSWEKDTFPKGDSLIFLSEILGKSIDWLLRGETSVLNGPNPENIVDMQHIDLVKRFKDRLRAREANESLLRIETLDRDTFIEVVGYIKGVANNLKPSASQPQGEEEPAATEKSNTGGR